MEQLRAGSIQRTALLAVAAAALLAATGCGNQDGGGSSADTGSAAAGSTTAAPRSRQLPKLSSAPASPRLMQLYVDAEDGREWIYDGVQWVPHDSGVDDYYQTLDTRTAGKRSAPTARSQEITGAPCVPTGAHAKHRAFDCTACHQVEGPPCFDPAGPAAAAGRPLPAFDYAGKTCSNVACHGAYFGTFTYIRWDWGNDCAEYVTVPYAGGGGATASWYATGATACTSCHGNPPSGYAWHDPSHAITMPNGRNCETCHPDAVSAVVGGKVVGVALNAAQAALHADGAVTVQARFSSQCFGCH